MSNYRSWSQRKFLIFKQTGCLQPLELVPRLVHLPPSQYMYLSFHLPLPPLALRGVLTAVMRLATLAAVNLDRPWSLFAQPCCGGDNFLPCLRFRQCFNIERLKVKILIMRKKWNFKKKKWHTTVSPADTERQRRMEASLKLPNLVRSTAGAVPILNEKGKFIRRVSLTWSIMRYLHGPPNFSPTSQF